MPTWTSAPNHSDSPILTVHRSPFTVHRSPSKLELSALHNHNLSPVKKYVVKRGKSGLPEKLTRYREELNEQQFKVVTSKPGPSLVIAGAGTGKTRTITYRVAYLLEQGVSPDRIFPRDIHESGFERNAQQSRIFNGITKRPSRLGRDISQDRQSHPKASRNVYRFRSELLDPRQ